MSAPPPKPSEAEEPVPTPMRALVREMLRLRGQHRRASTLRALYERRAWNLRTKVEALEESLTPVAERVQAHRAALRVRQLVGATPEARRLAAAELEGLRELERTLAAKEAASALDAYSAAYDSDTEVHESGLLHAAAGVGEPPVKKQRRPRGALRSAPNNEGCKKAETEPTQNGAA